MSGLFSPQGRTLEPALKISGENKRRFYLGCWHLRPWMDLSMREFCSSSGILTFLRLLPLQNVPVCILRYLLWLRGQRNIHAAAGVSFHAHLANAHHAFTKVGVNRHQH